MTNRNSPSVSTRDRQRQQDEHRPQQGVEEAEHQRRDQRRAEALDLDAGVELRHQEQCRGEQQPANDDLHAGRIGHAECATARGSLHFAASGKCESLSLKLHSSDDGSHGFCPHPPATATPAVGRSRASARGGRARDDGLSAAQRTRAAGHDRRAPPRRRCRGAAAGARGAPAVAEAAPMFVSLIAPKRPDPAPPPPPAIPKPPPPRPRPPERIVAAPARAGAGEAGVRRARARARARRCRPSRRQRWRPHRRRPWPSRRRRRRRSVPKTIPASAVQYLVPPNPTYPAQSKRLGETGRVTVRVFIDEAGTAKDVRVKRGPAFAARRGRPHRRAARPLQASTWKTARRWRAGPSSRSTSNWRQWHLEHRCREHRPCPLHRPERCGREDAARHPRRDVDRLVGDRRREGAVAVAAQRPQPALPRLLLERESLDAVATEIAARGARDPFSHAADQALQAQAHHAATAPRAWPRRAAPASS